MLTEIETVLNRFEGSDPVGDGTRKQIEVIAGVLVHIAEDFDLSFSRHKAVALAWYVANFDNLGDTRNRIREVRETLLNDLLAIYFLPADQDMRDYLDKELPYEKAVATVFPQCSEDINEAHQCFALGRHTATAFHISRAMEVAVRCVAKKMKVKASRDDWQSYITAMDEAIKKMPFKTPRDKAKRALYSEASNYLFNFKEAFRNKTMHPKKTYGRKEALRLLENAGDFFRHVAERLFKGRVAKAL